MILLGSTYPLSLIRREVKICPASLETLRERIAKEGLVSFWGHENTRQAVQSILGIDPRPTESRPALTLSEEGLPRLANQVFDEVWILSPDYQPNFRPQPGVEVSSEAIHSWQVLHLDFRLSSDG